MRINFVESIEPYLKSISKATEVGANMRYTIKDTKVGEALFIPGGEVGRKSSTPYLPLFTTGVNTCGGFILNSGKINQMGHIKPEGLNLGNFMREFENLVKEFQNKFGEMKVFVFGGRESSYIDPHSSIQSNNLLATMCNVISSKCKVQDESFASVFGKFNKIKTPDNVLVIGDEVYVANKEFGKAELKGLSKDEMARKVYEEVEIPEIFV